VRYNFDCEQVAAEFADFRETFKTLSCSTEVDQPIHVAEVSADTADNSADQSELCDPELNEEGDNISQQLPSQGQKAVHSFTEPLSLLYQLSGYEHLLRVYWTLVTLPVTSCSAERALSRLKIIKNRLRSTMSDEWMSDLMVLASEKDIVSSITNDAVIDSFANLSNQLKRQLVFF
jgi:hypothetical protein